MLITKLKSKIHKAVVTDTNLRYEESCAISKDLLEAANIQEYEQVHIYNINNGKRFTTYAIISDELGTISIRGSAARKVITGDTIIICTYCQVPFENEHMPIRVYVNEKNELFK